MVLFTNTLAERRITYYSLVRGFDLGDVWRDAGDVSDALDVCKDTYVVKSEWLKEVQSILTGLRTSYRP